MDPATYLLLGGIAFAAINNPGPMAVYPQWAAPTTVKMIGATFLRKKNYFLSYKNIERACFRMFDANIGAQYKVSNDPTLTGWNSTMSILDILTQLQDLYGKPTMMTLYQNDVTSGPQSHLPTLLKCSSIELSSPKKSNASESYHTPMSRSSQTRHES
jgi:hypothetical protein